MRRPVILGGNPYIADYYRKGAERLFDETGGNSGNLAFRYAISLHLPEAAHLPLGAKREVIRDAGDIVVLPLANQLGKHTNLESAAAILEQIGLPVLGLGLGAQAPELERNVELTPGTEKWLRTLASLSPSEKPNIGVRGSYTKAQVARFDLRPCVEVIGCPSNFINMGPDLARRIDQGFRRKPTVVAVAAGIPYLPELAATERDLVDIVTLTGGAYIVQHGLEMLRLARGEFEAMKPETLELCRQYIAPEKELEEFKSWCRRYAHAFFDARSWMDFLRRFDFVVGTRFHGAMLAIQVGVPAGCIAHDSRTLEMCQTTGIPVRHYKEMAGITKNNLLDYFRFDAESFEENRRRLLANYLGIFAAAEVKVGAELTRALH